MKNPEMRNELLDYLFSLSDFNYQKNCWVKGNCPPNIQHDEFDYSVHFLFDDTDLANNPDGLIGYILNDANEALLIKSVCEKITAIFNKYGTDLSDEQYINLSEWEEVIRSAKSAYDTLSSTPKMVLSSKLEN